MPIARADSSIVVGVRLTNLSATTKRLVIAGGCTVQLILSRATSERSDGKPVWDSRAMNVLCPAVGIVLYLTPGKVEDVRDTFPMGYVMGDSLPAAEYRARVTLHGHTTAGPLAAGQLWLGRQ